MSLEGNVERGRDYRFGAAALFLAVVAIATIPVLFVYPFVQRHFTKGVIIGAIKG